MSYRLGVDVGGTFTDLLVVDDTRLEVDYLLANGTRRNYTTEWPAAAELDGLQARTGPDGASLSDTDIEQLAGLPPIIRFGTPEQQSRFLPPLIAGKDRACFAVTEPNTGLNTLQLKTRAVREGEHYGKIPGTDKPSLFKSGVGNVGTIW
jgi:alkylation response protein AidB-like acyl-CoA dehydrogenase